MNIPRIVNWLDGRPRAKTRVTRFQPWLLERRRFASQAEARMACFGFIEGWYNPVRLHSGLGYRSPIAYETAMEMTIAEP